MKTYTIHLIRHGLIQGNLDGTYVGHTDAALCPRGERELAQLKDAAVYPDVQVLFSSPLKRCLETGAILYPDKKPIVLDGLIEYNFGAFDGKTADELETDKDFVSWLSGGGNAAPPFGESNDEFGRRVEGTFLKLVDAMLKTDTESAAVVTHGGVIMAIMAAFALPEAPMTDWMMDSGFGYTCRVTPTLWSKTQKMEAIARMPYFPGEDSGNDSNDPGAGGPDSDADDTMEELFWADMADSGEDGTDDVN